MVRPAAVTEPAGSLGAVVAARARIAHRGRGSRLLVGNRVLRSTPFAVRHGLGEPPFLAALRRRPAGARSWSAMAFHPRRVARIAHVERTYSRGRDPVDGRNYRSPLGKPRAHCVRHTATPGSDSCGETRAPVGGPADVHDERTGDDGAHGVHRQTRCRASAGGSASSALPVSARSSSPSRAAVCRWPSRSPARSARRSNCSPSASSGRRRTPSSPSARSPRTAPPS